VNGFVTGIGTTLRPRPGDPHGPLPPLMLGLTAVTGLVDAFSYLVLGHVFVANMTGNVVFLAFALVGARGFSIAAVLVALGAFALGAGVGGHLVRRGRGHRARVLAACTAVQAVLVAVAVVVGALHTGAVSPPVHYALITALGAAMGSQNAAARALAVPDLTTTVLTLTITGLAADPRDTPRATASAARRTLSLLVMFAGALVGAACVVHGQRTWDLVAALVLVVTVSTTTRLAAGGDPAWVRSAA